MADEQLKPCPFCGSKYVSVRKPGDLKHIDRHRVHCARCGTLGPIVGRDGYVEDEPESVIALWNDRGEWGRETL